MAKYIQKGNAIDYKNTGAGPILWGDVVVLPARIGVAEAIIEPGETGAVSLAGVYELDAAAEIIAFGDYVYWDGAAKAVTKTEAGNVPAGICLTDKAAADAGRVAVRLE